MHAGLVRQNDGGRGDDVLPLRRRPAQAVHRRGARHVAPDSFDHPALRAGRHERKLRGERIPEAARTVSARAPPADSRRARLTAAANAIEKNSSKTMRSFARAAASRSCGAWTSRHACASGGKPNRRTSAGGSASTCAAISRSRFLAISERIARDGSSFGRAVHRHDLTLPALAVAQHPVRADVESPAAARCAVTRPADEQPIAAASLRTDSGVRTIWLRRRRSRPAARR